MKTKLLLFFMMISFGALGQSIYPIKADSVIISKSGGYAELVVRNSTKDTLNGVMTNVGNGVMQYKRIRAVSDSEFVVGGDTIKIKGVPSLDFTTIPVDATVTAVYQSGTTLVGRGFGDSTFNSWVINGLGELVNVWDTAAVKAWILTFASTEDPLPTMTFTDGGLYTPFLNLIDDTTAVIKDVRDSIFSKWISYDLYNVHYQDTAAMRAWILGFAAPVATDTANLIFDSIPHGTTNPTALFQSGDTLRTRGFGDSTLISWVINGAGKLVAVLDTGNAFFDGGGGGGGGADANAWHGGGDAWGAYKTIGNTSNFGMGWLTNNTLRGRLDSSGYWLINGATKVTDWKFAVGDSSQMDYLRLGGVVTPAATPLTNRYNSRLVIKGVGTSTTTAGISIYNSAGTAIFQTLDDGSASFNQIFSAFTSSIIRFLAASATIGTANLGGTTGGIINITPLTVTSGTGTTTTAALKVNGGYNTSSPNTNTGEWTSLWLNSVFDQADAGTAPTSSIRIEGQLNAAANYVAIRILDGGAITTNGSIILNTAGGKINIATGSNASAGTGTLSSGSATINTTAVTASSLIFITPTSNSSLGTPYISAKTASTSFTVTSTNGSDASTFNWLILN
jgi:hypothetical protein